jgi:hypothetical protein
MGAERRDAALQEVMSAGARPQTQYDINQDATNRRILVTPQMIDDLCEQRLALTAYLLSKVKAGDYHAVQDAASDIREIEAKLSVLRA